MATMNDKNKKIAKTFAAYALTTTALLGGGFALQSGVNALQREPAAVTQTVQAAEAQTPATMDIASVPRGDGHPVLVIPGFFGNDLHMTELQHTIRDHGYTVYGWEAGMNMGPSKSKADQLEKHLQKIYEENGNRPVSIVGYSLGGVYARELARRHPELVANVITLGAPFGQRDSGGNVDERVAHVQEFYGTQNTDPRIAPPVPTTSLFSTNDWVAGWREALNTGGKQQENIRITGGHVAMPFSDNAAAIILDRLAQKTVNWQPMQKPAAQPLRPPGA
ncbi:MAG: alpha/beta fold hydrolase [Alphaproteobacteria bacterium]|nr:alpha/beta fold hydrolase [Alphaproteobacteria bacterium]